MCKYNKFHIISTNLGVNFHIISIILGLIFHICGFFVIKKGRCLQRPYRDYVALVLFQSAIKRKAIIAATL